MEIDLGTFLYALDNEYQSNIINEFLTENLIKSSNIDVNVTTPIRGKIINNFFFSNRIMISKKMIEDNIDQASKKD